MCGRFTRQYTWEELVRLYRLTEDYFKPNLQPRYNICPTTTIDTVVEHDGKWALDPMRWGLIHTWWKYPPKEMKLAPFNARVETVESKPMFPTAFKENRCFIAHSGAIASPPAATDQSFANYALNASGGRYYVPPSGNQGIGGSTTLDFLKRSVTTNGSLAKALSLDPKVLHVPIFGDPENLHSKQAKLFRATRQDFRRTSDCTVSSLALLAAPMWLMDPQCWSSHHLVVLIAFDHATLPSRSL